MSLRWVRTPYAGLNGGMEADGRNDYYSIANMAGTPLGDKHPGNPWALFIASGGRRNTGMYRSWHKTVTDAKKSAEKNEGGGAMTRSRNNPLMTTTEKVAIGLGIAGVIGLLILLFTRKSSGGATKQLLAGHTYKFVAPITALGGDMKAIQDALDFAQPGTFQVISVDSTPTSSTITVKVLKDMSADMSTYAGQVTTITEV